VLTYLEKMGCSIHHSDEGIRISGTKLQGAVLDLNNTPDALPALAVTACFAEGETRIINVPQARMKETDRIAVMTMELKKMGAMVEETPDGMIIQGSHLHGSYLNGHGDHRVVMSLALASLGALGKTSIDTAEAVNITYPGFFEQLQTLKA
jgi:3-phosphoshikimate 1-carboxyvinyltransferase